LLALENAKKRSRHTPAQKSKKSGEGKKAGTRAQAKETKVADVEAEQSAAPAEVKEPKSEAETEGEK
jgi:hypothetical protein